MKVINLDLLAECAGRTVLFTVERDVMPLDGAAYRVLHEIESEGSTDVRPLYEVAARLVPSLSPAEVDRLTAKQVGAILAIAGAPVQAVEESFPNSEGSAKKKKKTPAPV